MKCKKNYKRVGGKCVNKGLTFKLFGSKKNKIWDIKSITTLILFFIFSLVLFINNTTDLLDKYNIRYTMNFISWTALICVVVYWMLLLWIRRDFFK